ncbi:hypothetical protein Tco_0918921, partial [Tanacetum coccineum]
WRCSYADIPKLWTSEAVAPPWDPNVLDAFFNLVWYRESIQSRYSIRDVAIRVGFGLAGQKTSTRT